MVIGKFILVPSKVGLLKFQITMAIEFALNVQLPREPHLNQSCIKHLNQSRIKHLNTFPIIPWLSSPKAFFHQKTLKIVISIPKSKNKEILIHI